MFVPRLTKGAHVFHSCFILARFARDFSVTQACPLPGVQSTLEPNTADGKRARDTGTDHPSAGSGKPNARVLTRVTKTSDPGNDDASENSHFGPTDDRDAALGGKSVTAHEAMVVDMDPAPRTSAQTRSNTPNFVKGVNAIPLQTSSRTHVSGRHTIPLGQHPSMSLVQDSTVSDLHNRSDPSLAALKTQEISNELSPTTTEPQEMLLADDGAEDDADLRIKYRTARVTVHVANVPCQGLLDTGCNFAGVSLEHYSNVLSKLRFPMKVGAGPPIRLGDGHTGRTIARVRLPIKMQNSLERHMWFWIVPNLAYSVVLGTNYLTEAGAVMDFSAGTVRFPLSNTPNSDKNTMEYSEPISMNITEHSRHYNDVTVSLQTCETISLPPYSAAWVPATPIDAPWPTATMNGETVMVYSHPLMAGRSGLMVATGVTKIENNCSRMSWSR